MRSPRLIVRETDGWMADLVRGTAGAWQWTLREIRDTNACLAALREGGPCLFLLELTRDLARDLSLLEQAAWLCPETPVLVAAPGKEAAALAWDLGAAYVLTPPNSRDSFLEVVVGFMESARERQNESHSPKS